MAPGNKKWDDKKELDLLLAIRVAESGYNPVTRDTWVKATELMKMMGHSDSTWTGISQRWSKNTQKDFMKLYPQALQVAAGTVAVGAATVAAAPALATTTSAASGSGSGSGPAVAAPARRGRGRPPKRQREEEDQGAKEEDQDDGGEEVSAKKAPAAKKQKKD